MRYITDLSERHAQERRHGYVAFDVIDTQGKSESTGQGELYSNKGRVLARNLKQDDAELIVDALNAQEAAAVSRKKFNETMEAVEHARAE